MRVNVYGEELTDRIELVAKTVTASDGEEVGFYGLRFWLKLPAQEEWWIHRKASGVEDDDSSAITLWAGSREKLMTLLQKATLAVRLEAHAA